jgi:uncharacterized protein YaaR (DUF327 family)
MRDSLMIDGINRNSIIKPTNKKKKRKSGTNTGNVFSQILDVAEETEVVTDAEKKMEKVDEADRNLRENPNFENLEEYKKIVKAFVEEILDRCLRVSKKRGRLGNKTKVYVILEKISKFGYNSFKYNAIGYYRDLEKDYYWCMYSPFNRDIIKSKYDESISDFLDFGEFLYSVKVNLAVYFATYDEKLKGFNIWDEYTRYFMDNKF